MCTMTHFHQFWRFTYSFSRLSPGQSKEEEKKRSWRTDGRPPSRRGTIGAGRAFCCGLLRMSWCRLATTTLTTSPTVSSSSINHCQMSISSSFHFIPFLLSFPLLFNNFTSVALSCYFFCYYKLEITYFLFIYAVELQVILFITCPKSYIVHLRTSIP